MKLFNNKRGNYDDVGVYIVEAIGLVFVLIICFLIFNNFNNNIQANTTIPTESKEASSNFMFFFNQGDYFLLFVLLGFIVFSFVSARLIPSNSSFIIIGVIMCLIMPLVAMIANNIWDSFRTQTTIQTALLNFPLTSFLMDYMVIISFIYSIIILWALLSKNKEGTQ